MASLKFCNYLYWQLAWIQRNTTLEWFGPVDSSIFPYSLTGIVMGKAMTDEILTLKNDAKYLKLAERQLTDWLLNTSYLALKTEDFERWIVSDHSMAFFRRLSSMTKVRLLFTNQEAHDATIETQVHPP